MKVLILYNQLFHYRIPIFKLLAENVDLTVAYSIGKGTNEELNFKTLQLPIWQLGRFVVHKNNIFKLCNDYDVVIAYGDIAWLQLSTLPFFKSGKFKTIFWSPGVSASYDKKFDTVTKWDSVRDFFYKKADALVFYTDYPITKYLGRGFSPEKLFVAPNTVQVVDTRNFKTDAKDSLLFIGTLYMQKGILTLLENYFEAYKINRNILPLNLIGGGNELEIVKNWVTENKLSHKIHVHGPIFDLNVKAKYFEKAFACLSPVQAGLSVLESFGYGVPFITMHDSITGGERLNITDGINGILMKELSDLKSIIIDISENRMKYIQMGQNARKYYEENSKPIDMANGLLKAINYVMR